MNLQNMKKQMITTEVSELLVPTYFSTEHSLDIGNDLNVALPAEGLLTG